MGIKIKIYDTYTKVLQDTEATSEEDGALVIEGGLGVKKSIFANKVHNAVWNDIADFINVGEDTPIEFGKAYYRNKDGSIYIVDRKGIFSLGIASDTYGFGVGRNSKKKQIPIAIGGWVLAYVDKIYEAGTPLISNKDGILTKPTRLEKVLYPENIIAVFDRVEEEKIWNGIEVNGRHWVKVK